MSRLKEKAMASMPPAPPQQTQIKEVTPAVQNPDNSQKGKSKNLPGR